MLLLYDPRIKLVRHAKEDWCGLDLITDIDMLLFIEKGLRGGVSSIFHRYAKANNPYLIDDYDPSKETLYLGYFDANNLYGWAMSQHLPYGFFSWVNEGEDIEKLKNNIGSLTPNSNEGYILEVDLEYPLPYTMNTLISRWPLNDRPFALRTFHPTLVRCLRNYLERRRWVRVKSWYRIYTTRKNM